MRILAWAAVASVCGLLASAAKADLQATANIAESPATIFPLYYPYHYDLTLHNTGTENISTFWFAWDDSQLNFLPNYPYYISGPAGWIGFGTQNDYSVSSVPGYGIEWYNYDGNPLRPDASLAGFGFDTLDNPTVLAGLSDVPPVNPGDDPFPVATSFVYDHYPVADGDQGFQFVAAIGGAAAPEPASLSMLVLGVSGLLIRRRRNSH